MSNMSQRISCPVCNRDIPLASINRHLDEGCPEEPAAPETPISGFFAPASQKSKTSGSAAAAPSITGSGVTSRQPGNVNTSPVVGLAKEQSNSVPFGSSPAPKFQLQGKRTLPTSSEKGSLEIKSPNADPAVGGTVSIAIDHDESADIDSPASKRQKTTAISSTARSAMPLAERVRPTNLNHIFGQDLTGPNGILRRMIEADQVKSMILWGGPGCGKTTIARVIAARTKARFVELSGTTNNVADCKKIFDQARSEMGLLGRRTILFVDEIHRFSKVRLQIFWAGLRGEMREVAGLTGWEKLDAAGCFL
ncbi:hypothetical protein ABW19_dt0203297 [Dactylella cylindrospora]|nr:hypothetical protein ABW19_dt0203297 [Dactylella cylindrospora]